jgi:shikimate kinase
MIQLKNIYLTGFMGAGKTRIGQILAQKFQRRLVDTDQLIEQRDGRPISTIFEKDGEACFRKLETEIIRELSQQTSLVVALGGGVVLDKANRDILTQGLWVFINTPFEILKERILRRNHRPLGKDIDKLTALYESRLPLYLQAPIQVTASGDPEDVCQEVVKQILNPKL